MPKPLPRADFNLSAAQEDYLKSIYLLNDGRPVRTSALAERLGVSAASATDMLGKLAALGLVNHDRYRGASLTVPGQKVALEMVRHHRLIEMYLAEALGYGWDEVHEEAERLEHVISEVFEARIFSLLGHPEIDPHGDPIPSVLGEMPNATYRSLLDCRAGEEVTVRRVSDRDPEKLRALRNLGLLPGTQVLVFEESRFEGPLGLRVNGEESQVPIGLAREVFVEV